MGMILGYFGKKAEEASKKYRTFVEDILGTEYDSPLQSTYGTAVLGSGEFIEMVTATHLTDQKANRDVPALRKFMPFPSTADILRAVNAVMGENIKQARQVGMYLCHKYSGENLRELGALFNVGVSAITEASRLLTKKMEKDKALQDIVKRVKGTLHI
jgi:hypothetical protein